MAAATGMLAKCVAEFVGTYLLVFTVGCNVLAGNAIWGGMSIASVLSVAIYSFAGVSGANFNPAVSITLGISKQIGGPGMDWQPVGIYCGVQVVAGILAAASYAMLFWDTFSLGPAKGFSWVNAASCEILYTFMLCFVVLNVAAAKKNIQEKNQYFGLAIGFVLVAGVYGTGSVSGGCLNPAVATGIDVSSAGAGFGFGWCLAYTAFEIVGAALAVGAFYLVRPEDFGREVSTPRMQKLTSEFLGTFILVLTVGLNSLGHSPAAVLSIAASLTSMIYALGDVSGAHFNPAVTLAIFVSRRDKNFTAEEAAYYVLSQFGGGLVAAGSYTGIYHGNVVPLEPRGDFGWAAVGVAETIFTFVLCLVVLSVAVSEKTKTKDMFGFAIGSCITVGGFAIGSISGGSLNPAVSLGIAAPHIINGGGFFLNAAIYTVFELIGGVLAALVFNVTHEAEPKKLPEMEQVA
mmetsp:Transcript_101469/g.205971  ORF Transcript_101469/g.205971 Transcript_101469/m.205971 type:complete len:461 (-) Transcript_101469:78-1460(-)